MVNALLTNGVSSKPKCDKRIITTILSWTLRCFYSKHTQNKILKKKLHSFFYKPIVTNGNHLKNNSCNVPPNDPNSVELEMSLESQQEGSVLVLACLHFARSSARPLTRRTNVHLVTQTVVVTYTIVWEIILVCNLTTMKKNW